MKKKLALLITIIGISVFSLIFYKSIYYFPDDEVPLPKEVAEKISAQVLASVKSIDGMRLTIPKIDVDAKVVGVGITKKGNMAAPRVFSEVGWYKYGTFPGERGSTVLAGHVDNGVAFPAVFKNLEDLWIGDDIYIKTEEGKQLHFSVVSHDIYDFNANPDKVSKVFNENDGKLLKLITCTGSWIKELRTHDKRLVVSAVLVE